MRSIKRLLCALLLVAAPLTALPVAYATPIPEGTTFDDALIINFDFTSNTPAPPYVELRFLFTIGGWDLGEVIGVSLWPELNLGGNFVQSSGHGVPLEISAGAINIPFVSDSRVTDGVFSVGLLLYGPAQNRAADLLTATATGVAADGSFARLVGQPVAPVPEPGTLALLGLGLAGLAASRRRKQS